MKQLQSFLGLVNFYRKYILLFAQRAAPLDELLRKGTVFTWGERQQTSFEDLKACLKSDDIMLHLPDVNKPFKLKTDASPTVRYARVSAALGFEP